MLFQPNLNRFSVPVHIQARSEPKLPNSRDSVTKTLQSLVVLEEKVASQAKAMQDLKSRALAPSLNTSLLEEAKLHHTEMEATLATLTALWCKDSSVAISLKQDLKSKLQKNIEDIKHFKHVLTNTGTPGMPVTMCKMIDVDKPGGFSIVNKRVVHSTDLGGRRTLYSLLARLQLPPAAKFVPSACPGLFGPLDSALKQLQTGDLEG
jgi:hypothetical protein